MRFKYLILFLFTFISFIQTKSNNIYLELFGPTVLGSINYEKSINNRLLIRAGFGLPVSYEKSSYVGDAKLRISPILIGVNYLRGNKIKLDLGGGFALWSMNYEGDIPIDLDGIDINTDGSFPVPFITLGSRYQNLEKIFNLKFGLSIMLLEFEDTSGVLPNFYLGSGFLF
tara:strand:- start:39 stop:551 length:513 start_codon:yes stop_codon:yes gene_type:complete